mmetsp:Transcript_50675/g.118401  ORF Transcript_50675/g.118401 Transcript_50675/m.118401 type:complete len:94 (-) Transcript_50675:59-340(-)
MASGRSSSLPASSLLLVRASAALGMPPKNSSERPFVEMSLWSSKSLALRLFSPSVQQPQLLNKNIYVCCGVAKGRGINKSLSGLLACFQRRRL